MASEGKNQDLFHARRAVGGYGAQKETKHTAAIYSVWLEASSSAGSLRPLAPNT
jgi:hypothetical protein